MRQRRGWVMGLAAAWGLLLLACTALLGDFSNAPGVHGGAEGGSAADGSLETEGGSSDDAGARDGSTETADSASPPGDGSVTDSGVEPNDSGATSEGGGPDAAADAADAGAASDGATGDAGVHDAATGDAPLGDGASSDAASGDAAGDAGPPAAFVCSPPATTFEIGSIPNAHPGQVGVYQTSKGGTNGYEVVVPDSATNSTHVFVYTSGHTSGTDIPVPAALRVAAVTRYAGGLAALTLTSASTGFQFTIDLLPDGAASWSTSVTFLQEGFAQCVSNLQASFVVNDVPTDDYDVFFSYEDCSTPVSSSFAGVHVVDGGTNKATTWPPPTDAGLFLPTLAGGAVDPTVAAVLVDVSLTGAGEGPYLYTSNPTLTTPIFHTLVPSDPANDVEGLALAPVSQGNLGVSLVELNPSFETTTLYTGTIAPSAATSLTVGALPKTVFSSISAIPFLNATYHWETFVDAGDALVGVGGQYPGNTGLNFLWQDRNGSILAFQGGTSAFFPAATINGGSATFITPPTATEGDFFVAYLQSDPDASTTTDVMGAEISCAPAP